MKTKTRKIIRTADVIATLDGKFVLVERLTYPPGLALPGGHVDPGEAPRESAARELREETGLTFVGGRYWKSFGGKKRDPRGPTHTRVYAGEAKGTPKGNKGETGVTLKSRAEILALPIDRFAFDHGKILRKYLSEKR